MKNILLLLLLPVFGVSQDIPIVDDRIVYEKIFEYPGISKETIYAAAKQHIGTSFKSATDVIKTEDYNSGLIVCKGNVSVYETYDKTWLMNYSVGNTFHFTLQFDVKEARCRVRIFDIHTSNVTTYGTSEKALETIIFDKARATNRSTGKRKERRMKEFEALSSLLNRTFYGHLDQFDTNVKEYSDDDW